MADDLSDGLRKMAERIEDHAREDSARFASLNSDECQLCQAKGDDKRSLFIDCFYALHETVSEAILLTNIEGEIKSIHSRGYYMRICKTCRGRLLEHLRVWAEECRTMRGMPKDPDGSPIITDPERNIPVRIDGAIVMLTRAEWEIHRAKRETE